MQAVGRLLSALGRHGPILLVISLGLGVASPHMARAGYGLLPLSAFLLTLGSFLTAGLAPSEAKIRTPLVGIVLAWLGIGLPLLAAIFLWLIPLDPSLRSGVLLSLLAPPVGSAAAIAAMLALQPRLALLTSIALTLVAPISIPCFAVVLGLGVAFDMGTLAIRLFAIIGAAAAVAWVVLRFGRSLRTILPDQGAATGIAVVGLVIVGLATSQGVQTHWKADPASFERLLAAAVALNFGACVIGTIVFARLGLQAAATIGLLSGNRNVTLAWAAASFGLPPLAEGYVAACVIPVLALPLLVRFCLALSGWVTGFFFPKVTE
jgi:hypothetical protein